MSTSLDIAPFALRVTSIFRRETRCCRWPHETSRPRRMRGVDESQERGPRRHHRSAELVLAQAVTDVEQRLAVVVEKA
jgi:hypothetical protein